MNNYDKKEIHLMDFISVKPDRIIRQQKVYKIGKEFTQGFRRKIEGRKVERKYHEFVISENSQKKLREKIGWLYRFAKGRTVRTYTGKELHNFKVSFITLTLPSAQSHATSEIMKTCFEPLLTLLRNHLKMENYVWKLEFQKNGNCHFHLLTDTYVDYFYIRQKWNEKLKVLGYIDSYQDKFKEYNLSRYLNEFSDGTQQSIAKCSKWYATGKASNWRNPNTADVRNVVSDRQLSFYLSKYLSKQSKQGGNESYDSEENSFGLRLCFWSRSLSRCKSAQMPFDFFEFDFEHLKSFSESFNYAVYDYCQILYLRWEKMTNYLKMKFSQLFGSMRQDFSYRPVYV